MRQIRLYGSESEGLIENTATSMGLQMDEVRWYDGYRYGNKPVYNPWSILNYAFALEPALKPTG
ncbi:MAG: hypothetical protein R2795_23165 [Saprospiraceae bacterium]